MEHKIKKNVSALFLLQASNYLLPLLTIPYLIHTLGIENFGFISFINAITAYFVIIVDFGFNLSATKKISEHKHDANKCSRIFCSVTIARLFLLVITYLALLLLSTYSTSLEEHRILLNIAFMQVIGTLLFPIWIYQGKEEMIWITIFSFSTRFIFTISVFIFVRNENEAWLVLLLTGLGAISVGLISIVHVTYRYHIHYALPKINEVREALRDSWKIFAANISINVYTNSIIVVLGLFTSNAEVGYFTAAEKVLQVFKRMYDPFSQAVFPHISNLIKTTPKRLRKFISRYIILGLFYGCFSLLILLHFPVSISEKFFGSESTEVLNVLAYFSPIPLLVIISNIFGIQILININCSRDVLIVTSIGACVGMASQFYWISVYGAVGAAISLVIVELFITVMLTLVGSKRLANYLANLKEQVT